jgi:type III secretion protein V
MGMLGQIANNLASRKDLALVALLMIIIAVMILPLPTFLMDSLIVMNMSLTILILMVSIYLHKAEDFGVFPTVILLATTFRLAISISTTRLILSQADAGAIIETFGVFVTQGSVVVGLVIFIIITTVQFIVVTKGAERVAEVAARFTLDAMPGRQMSIDAELRNGDIDQAEASIKRQELEKENKFFGAMDGAMKFVKGDAIAGIIIIIVNLAGGFGIGTVSKGMSAADAASVYSRLTVGDGLVSQIPALLLAICAGLVITRVTTQEKSDLGTDIVSQLAGSGKTLIVAGVIVGILGFVPGFPVSLFLIVSAIFIFSGIAIGRREKQKNMPTDVVAGAQLSPDQMVDGEQVEPLVEADAGVKDNDTVWVNVSNSLYELIDPVEFTVKRNASIDNIIQKLGQYPPKFGYTQIAKLAPLKFEIIFDNVPVFSSKMEADSVVVICEKQVLELLGISLNPLGREWPIKSAFWVSQDKIDKLKDVDAQILNYTEILVDVGTYYLVKNAASIIGFGHVEHILKLLGEEHPELASQVASQANAVQLLDIIRALVDESVPIYSRRLLFEGLLGSLINTSGTVSMTEYMRKAVRRQICHNFADENNEIASYVTEPDLEAKLRQSIRGEKDERHLAIDAQTANSILTQVGRINNLEDINVTAPVIVISTDIRPLFRKFLKNHNFDLDVIAFQEVAPEFNLRPIGTITLMDKKSSSDNLAA